MATRASTRRTTKQTPQSASSASATKDKLPEKKSLKRSSPDEQETSVPSTRPAKKFRKAKIPAEVAEAAAEKAKTAQEKAEKAAQKAIEATEKKAAKDKAAAEKKAEKERAAAEKKAKKDSAAAEKQEKQHRKDAWSTWVLAHSADDTRFKRDPEVHDTLTQTNCKTFYGLTPEDLRTLPHDEAFNSHNRNVPSKLFKREDVQKLAWRKYAVLAGIETEDEEKLLELGKATFEKEHGPVDVSFENRKRLEAEETKNKPKSGQDYDEVPNENNFS